MRPQLADLLAAVPHPHAALALDHLQRGRGKEPGKGYIDSTKLTDHHAIIPTREPIPASITRDGNLGQLYALIVSRFVAIFFSDEVTEETTVRLDIGGHVFLASGRRRVQEGWRVVEPLRQEDAGEGAGEVQLPTLRSRQTVEVGSLEVVEKETGPPKRYTDATLLGAMKNAGRTLDDESQAEVLKEAGGLGTPATRAAVIEGLAKRGYVVRKGKTVLSTDKGRALVGVVSAPLRSAELTAQWERELREVEQGNGTAAGFLAGIEALVRELLPQVQSSPGKGAGKQQRPGKADRSVSVLRPGCCRARQNVRVQRLAGDGLRLQGVESDERQEAERRAGEGAAEERSHGPDKGLQVEGGQTVRGGVEARRGRTAWCSTSAIRAVGLVGVPGISGLEQPGPNPKRSGARRAAASERGWLTGGEHALVESASVAVNGSRHF